jgi:hypothetical protein
MTQTISVMSPCFIVSLLVAAPDVDTPPDDPCSLYALACDASPLYHSIGSVRDTKRVNYEKSRPHAGRFARELEPIDQSVATGHGTAAASRTADGRRFSPPDSTLLRPERRVSQLVAGVSQAHPTARDVFAPASCQPARAFMIAWAAAATWILPAAKRFGGKRVVGAEIPTDATIRPSVSRIGAATQRTCRSRTLTSCR